MTPSPAVWVSCCRNGSERLGGCQCACELLFVKHHCCFRPSPVATLKSKLHETNRPDLWSHLVDSTTLLPFPVSVVLLLRRLTHVQLLQPPMECSLPGLLSRQETEWVAIPFVRSSPPRDQNLHLLHWQVAYLPRNHQESTSHSQVSAI